MEQGSAEWLAVRCGKATASRISDIMAKGRGGAPSAGRANYAAQLIAERLTGTVEAGFSSGPMQWGTDQEPNARASYSFLKGVTVEQVAFVLHPIIADSGASPDGLVGDDGLVEFKCPNTATHIATLTGAPIKGGYVSQIQWQLACTERTHCDFVSYDPRLPVEMQTHIVRVDRDDEAIAEMEAAVSEFLAEVAATVADLDARYRKEAA